MSADGYFRIPRKLLLSGLTMERQYALAWMISQASYAEREVGGVVLKIGETPPISLTMLEERFKWTRKAVRVFLDYALSPKCTEETGIRFRIGRKVEGHSKGHREGHRLGHTYIVGLVRFTEDEGHSKGHREGHRLGHTGKKTEDNTGSNSLPTGEKQHKRARGSRKVPADWQPSPELETELRAIAVQRGADYGEQMVMLRDHEFPRPYTDWPAVARNWMRRASPSLNGKANGNGRNGGARWGRGEDWRYRRDGESARDDPIFAEVDEGGD